MDHRINSTGCSNRCRHRCKKFRIQDRIFWKQIKTEYRQFIISGMICNYRECCHFTSCSCSSRNSNNRIYRSRYFIAAFVFCDRASIFRHKSYSLSHIHRTSTTECHDSICFHFTIFCCCLIYSIYGRITFYISEHITANS